MKFVIFLVVSDRFVFYGGGRSYGIFIINIDIVEELREIVVNDLVFKIGILSGG